MILLVLKLLNANIGGYYDSNGVYISATTHKSKLDDYFDDDYYNDEPGKN
jgi:hypothetical protein